MPCPPAPSRWRPSRDEIPTIVVPAGALVDVCRILRDHPSLRFNVCLDVTAADHFPRAAPLPRRLPPGVDRRRRLTLRVKVHSSVRRPGVPTISGVWRVGQLAGARGLGSVRHRLHRPSAAGAAADAGRLGRASAAEGLSGAGEAAGADVRAAAADRRGVPRRTSRRIGGAAAVRRT